ncbi:MAG: hypothetical protein GEV04_02235 [Actinophytocola sp.]|nr:hypothetical protein [Actinophytocola sp.]
MHEAPPTRTTLDAGTAPPGDVAAHTTTPEPRPRLRHALRRIGPELAALVACCVLYWQTAGYTAGSTGGPGPALYPRILIGLLAVALVFLIVRELRASIGGRAIADDELASENLSRRRIAVVMGMTVGYVIATVYLGWVIATACFVTLFLYLSGKRRLWLTIPLAVALSVGFAFIFVKVVYISLPTGFGIFDLITFRLLQLIGAY